MKIVRGICGVGLGIFWLSQSSDAGFVGLLLCVFFLALGIMEFYHWLF